MHYIFRYRYVNILQFLLAELEQGEYAILLPLIDDGSFSASLGAQGNRCVHGLNNYVTHACSPCNLILGAKPKSHWPTSETQDMVRPEFAFGNSPMSNWQ